MSSREKPLRFVPLSPSSFTDDICVECFRRWSLFLTREGWGWLWLEEENSGNMYMNGETAEAIKCDMKDGSLNFSASQGTECFFYSVSGRILRTIFFPSSCANPSFCSPSSSLEFQSVPEKNNPALTDTCPGESNFTPGEEGKVIGVVGCCRMEWRRRV